MLLLPHSVFKVQCETLKMWNGRSSVATRFTTVKSKLKRRFAFCKKDRKLGEKPPGCQLSRAAFKYGGSTYLSVHQVRRYGETCADDEDARVALALARTRKTKKSGE